MCQRNSISLIYSFFREMRVSIPTEKPSLNVRSLDHITRNLSGFNLSFRFSEIIPLSATRISGLQKRLQLDFQLFNRKFILGFSVGMHTSFTEF